ncbi:hypothetical protein [Hymenobacter glaciei]|uniref:hypothetical protein n=1 Tax=Hymenobacter glaciei TaxID=877209 RepID=UPI0031EB27C1
MHTYLAAVNGAVQGGVGASVWLNDIVQRFCRELFNRPFSDETLRLASLPTQTTSRRAYSILALRKI